jgi:hypothetical protein
VRFLSKLFRGSAPSKPARAEDRFAEILLTALRDRDRGLQASYDPTKFELAHEDGHKTFLYNTFAEFQRASEDDRTALIERFVTFIIESRKPAASGEAALDALMPVLRDRAGLIATYRTLAAWPHNRSARPFCETMLLMLAIDNENSIALLTDEGLAELGISFDDALGLATAHLNERGEHRFGQIGDGTFVSTCDDYYDASRILIPELISELAVNGNHVAIVEARSAILITGSEDWEGLDQIAGFAWQDFPENERAISLTPIELRDGKWELLTIRDDHPQSLRNLIQYQRLWSYDATKDVLQEELGDDLFVASAMLVEQDSCAATVASWGTDVRTACPVVDAVVIEADGDFPQITRRFEDVMAICGPFPLVEAMPYPPRYALPGRVDAECRRELTEAFPDYQLFPASPSS